MAPTLKYKFHFQVRLISFLDKVATYYKVISPLKNFVLSPFIFLPDDCTIFRILPVSFYISSRSNDQILLHMSFPLILTFVWEYVVTSPNWHHIQLFGISKGISSPAIGGKGFSLSCLLQLAFVFLLRQTNRTDQCHPNW